MYSRQGEANPLITGSLPEVVPPAPNCASPTPNGLGETNTIIGASHPEAAQPHPGLCLMLRAADETTRWLAPHAASAPDVLRQGEANPLSRASQSDVVPFALAGAAILRGSTPNRPAVA